MKKNIPFGKPFIIGKELDYIAQSVANGQISGDGHFTKLCHQFIESAFGAKKALLTTSCTAALEMSAILCDIKEGDEVILPSYTFVSTANAFLLRGATLKFVDIRPDTLNIDEKLIEEAVSDKTKVIVPVHYAGVACEMDAIMATAQKHDLIVVEDAAQGVNAKYKGTFLGTIGDMGTYSYHETKNFICGEGGTLLVNDDQYLERAEIIREKGTNRSQFFRGQVDKYTWVDVGSSYLPSDILAAFLYAQLENMEPITQKRAKIYQTYYELLQPLAKQGLFSLPVIPEECESNFHMFYILLQDIQTRMELIAHLKERGILSVFHYVPLHTSPVGQSLGYRKGMLPLTENLSERVLRLPFYFELEEDDIYRIARDIYDFFKVKPGF